MSLREKTAWITLLTVLICFGVYFGGIATGAVSPHGFDTLHLLLACVTAMAVLQLVLHAVVARRSPKAPHDERERLIQLRSHTVGYYVLIAGVLLLGVPGHMAYRVRDILNFALLAVVVAALAVSAAQIVMFRRGA
ncbi:hypothetical protein [Phenylobacterium sp.]|jgi:hypothetical protein|uniref:hypothetical protein n=1 Tax=Phenylobacterium sp. TaxID=1871053 RepID=UPI002F92ABDA